ncbi:SHOCT domain-containing protein [Halovenus rubra]|uniref:SHOCT domain-containing protein n=2 Tax=Halovenus rubra TaxID=869890 RepID=A0ABD5X8H6_9EURY|nr:SHOCT domain-containing protein [Halovenus rubra]
MVPRLSMMLVPIFAVVTLPLGILAGLYVSLQAAVTVFVVGWFLLTPLAALLLGFMYTSSSQMSTNEELEQSRQTNEKRQEAANGADGSDSVADPVEKLRDRYARGEIDEVELERRLDTLIEMEDVDSTDKEVIERVADTLDTDNSVEGHRENTDTGTESDDLLSEHE